MCGMKASRFDVLEVTRDDLLVHDRSVLAGAEVMDGVQVRNVDAALVGLRALMTILINVHAEEDDVLAVDVLKENKTLCSTWKLSRVILMFVALKHTLAYSVQFVQHRDLVIKQKANKDSKKINRKIEIKRIIKMIRIQSDICSVLFCSFSPVGEKAVGTSRLPRPCDFLILLAVDTLIVAALLFSVR